LPQRAVGFGAKTTSAGGPILSSKHDEKRDFAISVTNRLARDIAAKTKSSAFTL
ncbi:hypothetical protein Csa_019531, partial [Cucumis sativus]